MPSEKLERLAAELVAVAQELRRECREDDEEEKGGYAAVASDLPLPARDRAERLERWRDLAGRIYRFRRARDRLFGPIFGEPAWDILLDLFVMEAKGARVPVSSACIASGASHSTALRQVDELVRHGLVERVRDEQDKRRTYLMLSTHGLGKLAMVFEQFADERQSGQVANKGPVREERIAQGR